MVISIPAWADVLCWQLKHPSELQGGLPVAQHHFTNSRSTSLLCAGEHIPNLNSEIVPAAGHIVDALFVVCIVWFAGN